VSRRFGRAEHFQGLDDFTNVTRRRGWCGGSGKVQKLRDELVQPAQLFFDDLDKLTLGMPAGKIGRDDLERSFDGSERVFDLVSYAGRKLSERRQSIRAEHVIEALLEPLVGIGKLGGSPLLPLAQTFLRLGQETDNDRYHLKQDELGVLRCEVLIVEPSNFPPIEKDVREITRRGQ
jgi:hypothetical protein